MPTPAPAGASSYVPTRSVVPTVIAEYPLNPYEALVATLSERPDGRRTAAIVRIKRERDGSLRRKAVLEFGEHRIMAVISLLDELARAIASRRAP